MSNAMFAGYGDIDEILSPWIKPEDLTIERIESLALQALENFKDPEAIFLSLDIYAELVKLASRNLRLTSANGLLAPVSINSFVTSAGELRIEKVYDRSNFCFVGTLEEYDKLLWKHINEKFEEVVFGASDET